MEDQKLTRDLTRLADEHIPGHTDLLPQVERKLNTSPSRSSAQPRSRYYVAAVASALVVILVLFNVPAVRAQLSRITEIIGGISFSLSEDYPGKGETVTTIPSDYLPVEEAQVSYSFIIPDWSPAGYELDPEARLTWLDPTADIPFIELTWVSPGRQHITLSIQPLNGQIVGLTTIETLEIGEQQIAFWKGGWNYDTQAWDETIEVQTLSWSNDDVSYHLGAPTSVPLDDLTHMVESIQP